MADVKAADLPDRSVVADAAIAYIKTRPTKTAQWQGTNGGYFRDWFIDGVLADGGEVLRHGYPEDD